MKPTLVVNPADDGVVVGIGLPATEESIRREAESVGCRLGEATVEAVSAGSSLVKPRTFRTPPCRGLAMAREHPCRVDAVELRER